MLDERQFEAIDLYVKGNKIIDIAKIIGVSRQTVYDWMKKDEFKAEVDRRLALMKSDAKNKISSKVDTYISELERIALTSKSDKTRTDALTYLIDHVIGKSTTKIEEVTNEDKSDTTLSWDDLEKSTDFDNVVELNIK